MCAIVCTVTGREATSVDVSDICAALTWLETSHFLPEITGGRLLPRAKGDGPSEDRLTLPLVFSFRLHPGCSDFPSLIRTHPGSVCSIMFSRVSRTPNIHFSLILLACVSYSHAHCTLSTIQLLSCITTYLLKILPKCRYPHNTSHGVIGDEGNFHQVENCFCLV